MIRGDGRQLLAAKLAGTTASKTLLLRASAGHRMCSSFTSASVCRHRLRCCLAHLDVRDLRDSKHSAYEEAGQHIVVVHVLPKPHLDLQQKEQYTTASAALLACGAASVVPPPADPSTFLVAISGNDHLEEIIL
jgi:hypothetical protein